MSNANAGQPIKANAGNTLGANAEAKGRTLCRWCHKPFKAMRETQVYCTPYHRQRACECRKSALIDALAGWFERFGLKRQHIELCAELWLKRIQEVAALLGFTYDEIRRAYSASSSSLRCPQ